MVQFFNLIPASLISWIESQKLFWVGTAPLAEDGHVNVSPKGCFEHTLNVVLEDQDDFGPRQDPNRSTDSVDKVDKRQGRAVWYEDLTGSGIETIAHVRENGRITVMLTALEGPPQIVRIFGKGRVYEFGTPEYNTLLPPQRRQPGSRAVIWVDIHQVSTSCGYSIPFFEYKEDRVRLHKFAAGREKVDAQLESTTGGAPASDASSTQEGNSSSGTKTPKYDGGIKSYWKTRNAKSIDGLPGLETCFDAQDTPGTFTASMHDVEDRNDDERLDRFIAENAADRKTSLKAKDKAKAKSRKEGGRPGRSTSEKLVVGFGIGVLAGIAITRFANRFWPSSSS